MRTIILLLTLLAASCVPKAIVVGPIAPKAVVVREAATRAARSAAVVQKSAVSVHTEATGIVKEAVTLKAETERLSHQVAISPAEWDAFKTLHASHYQSVFAHEITARQTEVQSTEHAAEQAVAAKEAAELVTHAEATDKNTVAIVAKAEALKDNAAIGKSVKWIIGLVLLLLLIVFIIVPLIRKSIVP